MSISPLPVQTSEAFVNYVSPGSMASLKYFMSFLDGRKTKTCVIQRPSLSIMKTIAYICARDFRWFYFDVDSPISVWVDAGLMRAASIIRFCPFIHEPSKYPEAVVKVGDYMFMEWEYKVVDILREFGSLRAWFVEQEAKAFGALSTRPPCIPGLSIIVDGVRIANILKTYNVCIISKHTDPALLSRLATAVPLRSGAAAMWIVNNNPSADTATIEDAVVDAENGVVSLSFV